MIVSNDAIRGSIRKWPAFCCRPQILKNCVANQNAVCSISIFNAVRVGHIERSRKFRQTWCGFSTVGIAWSDPHRLIFRYPGMARGEVRWQFSGHDGEGILTVRFTIRAGVIRVIGAGYWRKQRKLYETKKKRS